MAQSKKKEALRYAFLVANGLFWALSITLICYNTYLAVEKEGTYKSQTLLEVLLYFTFICGAGIFISGLIGCCTGIRLNKKCITAYLVLSIIFLVIGVITMILAIVGSSNLGLDAWNNMDVSEQATVQTEFGCCGFEDPVAEADNSTLYLDISCYNITAVGNVTYFEPYIVGCKDYLDSTVSTGTLIVACIIACIILAGILGVTTGAIIWRRIKPKRDKEEELLQEGFDEKPKHRYRKIDGPVDVNGAVYQKES